MAEPEIPALLPALDSLDLRRRTDSGPASVPPDTIAYRIHDPARRNDLHGRHRDDPHLRCGAASAGRRAAPFGPLAEGRPLSVCAAEFDAESLRTALDKLEAGLSELDFSHNNLKPGNLYVTSDGRLIPVRYHFARFGEGHDAEGFERLRQFVREQGGKGQMLCDAEPSRYTTLPEFPGHLFVGEMSDQLVRVEDETGYGFVDTENRPVIAPQFVWAADFREGRAEVQTAQGMGLIDKRGRYVIEPRYEIVDYNPYTGCSRIRSEGLWALADYNGRIVGGFTPRYIEENEYVEA